MNKTENRKKSRASTKSYSVVPQFLLKTHEILENAANSEIISWNREGTAFVVKRINEFSEKILPLYFKHNNFASFVRQLNMYDFHKSRQEANMNEFQHKAFLKGRKELLPEIKRKNADSSSQHAREDENTVADRAMSLEEALKNDITKVLLEVDNLKQRVSHFEATTHTLEDQNDKLLDENRALLTELVRSREKLEKKTDVIMMILYTIISPAAIKFFKRSFSGSSNIFTDEPQSSKTSDTAHSENTITLTPEKFLQLDPERLRKLFGILIENGFNPDILFENVGNSTASKSNLFKNYSNILNERDKGLFNHKQDDFLEPNERIKFDFGFPDHNYEMQGRFMPRFPHRGFKGHENLFKYAEEDSHFRDFMRKIQKKDNSSPNMLNAPLLTDAIPKLDKLLFDDFKIELNHLDEEDIHKKQLNFNGGDKSPLISRPHFTNDEFPEPFELEHKSSFQSIFQENSHENHQGFAEFSNYIDHPIHFEDPEHTNSPNHDDKQSNFMDMHQ